MSKPIEPVYRQIGGRIEQIRRILDITQEQLAQRVGMSRGSVANIEIGRQRMLLDDVEKFAAALHSTPRVLMKGIWT